MGCEVREVTEWQAPRGRRRDLALPALPPSDAVHAGSCAGQSGLLIL